MPINTTTTAVRNTLIQRRRPLALRKPEYLSIWCMEHVSVHTSGHLQVSVMRAVKTSLHNSPSPKPKALSPKPSGKRHALGVVWVVAERMHKGSVGAESVDVVGIDIKRAFVHSLCLPMPIDRPQ